MSTKIIIDKNVHQHDERHEKKELVENNIPHQDNKEDVSYSHNNILLLWMKSNVNIVMYVSIAVISFLMRILFSNFSDDGKMPVFDEKHYAAQAQEMLLNRGMEFNPGYGLIVHPPFGKWIISIGEFLFGYSPIGWRILPMIAGVITVLSVSAVVHKITQSKTLTILSALLINIEGISLTMSRVGMLDSFVEMFASLILLFSVYYIYNDFNKKPFYKSYWLFAVGITGGLMTATKISGLYYMAFCGVSLVLTTAITSRSVKKTLSSIGMGIFYVVVVPISIFMASFVPWFSNENAVFRHALEEGKASSDVWYNFLPNSLQNFIYYQKEVMDFHTSLHTAQTQFHPYESKAWEWLIGARPMTFLTTSYVGDESVARVVLFANPAVWFLMGIVFVSSFIMICRKDYRWIIVLAGFITGWIPWLIMSSRQMYLFYTAPLAPFFIIGIILLIDNITSSVANKGKDKNIDNIKDENSNEIVLNDETEIAKDKKKNKLILSISITYGLLCLIVFAGLSPWVYQMKIPDAYDTWLFDAIPRWSPLNEDNLLESFPNLPPEPPEN